jgi:hypothetical protein
VRTENSSHFSALTFWKPFRLQYSFSLPEMPLFVFDNDAIAVSQSVSRQLQKRRRDFRFSPVGFFGLFDFLYDFALMRGKLLDD